jgi:hypothetical protein
MRTAWGAPEAAADLAPEIAVPPHITALSRGR